ncbi:hypothetical protein OIU84_003901 [Salix udensis]|uniref:Uncharacterized protein n=1 Tax=Salix udensis TaxID=889485 RepID=A0AAD6K340_9ROSI|nr:hypothetical protein OIU84_003901 [Salix udensis]
MLEEKCITTFLLRASSQIILIFTESLVWLLKPFNTILPKRDESEAEH